MHPDPLLVVAVVLACIVIGAWFVFADERDNS